jgi:Flp pilus assembly protein TadB
VGVVDASQVYSDEEVRCTQHAIRDVRVVVVMTAVVVAAIVTVVVAVVVAAVAVVLMAAVVPRWRPGICVLGFRGTFLKFEELETPRDDPSKTKAGIVLR